jgi:hypothetical protein
MQHASVISDGRLEPQKQKIYTPYGAVEAGIDPLAWYIDHLEREIDHFGLYCVVDVFKYAGFDSIPLDLLLAYKKAEDYLDRAREATEGFLKQLEAIHSKRKQEPTAGQAFNAASVG